MEAVIKAILGDDRNTVKKLLKADPSLITKQFVESINYEEIVHWIYKGDTLLHLVSAGYRVEIAKMLIKAGTDVNSVKNHRKSSPLHYASDGYINHAFWDEKRQVKTIKYLLDAGADINGQDKNGATPLHRAVRTRCAEAVNCLFKAGFDPTIKNKSGSTPFHLAVQNTGRGGTGTQITVDSQRKIIETFISFGIDPNLKDGKGITVLDSAKSSGIGELFI